MYYGDTCTSNTMWQTVLLTTVLGYLMLILCERQCCWLGYFFPQIWSLFSDLIVKLPVWKTFHPSRGGTYRRWLCVCDVIVNNWEQDWKKTLALRFCKLCILFIFYSFKKSNPINFQGYKYIIPWNIQEYKVSQYLLLKLYVSVNNVTQ